MTRANATKGTDEPADRWAELRDQLPREVANRLERLTRRALDRWIGQLSSWQAATVPDAVRSQAVAEWRRRYMKGRSKSAKRKKNYERLRREPSFQDIVRELAGPWWEARETALPGKPVADMGFGEVCETYRSIVSDPDTAPFESLLADVVMATAPERGLGDAAREQLMAELASVVRTEDLEGYALAKPRKRAWRAGRAHRHMPETWRSGGSFLFDDVTSEEGIADRMLEVRLAEGIVRGRHQGATIREVARDLVASHIGEAHDVSVVLSFMRALLGSDEPAEKVLTRIAKSAAGVVEASLVGRGCARELTAELMANPRYAKQYERAVELRLRVRERVPETPMDAFPLARTMRRRVVLHVGPTNSGKTHDALMALAAAESGSYLGPLRLLAYEQFVELNRLGTPCSLLTGEEAVEVAGARHVSSTVEMASYHTPVACAVIDEAQMVADAERGYRWTSAILGVPAAEVHVCCAPHAEAVVSELVRLCDDDLEVVRHERLVPLEGEKGGFELPDDVQPGDALVVFSRRSVHAVAAQVAAAGLRPSLIYGALPHDVRHEEARRFDEGETDVVVATDAIGMGMNLPIRRVVFVEQEKFDGRTTRPLLPEEVQQIAGRAGRYGRYDLGLYQSSRQGSQIRRRYREQVRPIERIPVGIPEDIALVRDAKLTDCIRQWMAMEQPEPFRRIGVERDLALIGVVEARVDESLRTDIETKRLVLALATMAFDERDRELYDVWLQMVKAELAGKEAVLDVPRAPAAGDALIDLEHRYRHCDLLYTYARTFRHGDRLPSLSDRRNEISHAIMELLAKA